MFFTASTILFIAFLHNPERLPGRCAEVLCHAVGPSAHQTNSVLDFDTFGLTFIVQLQYALPCFSRVLSVFRVSPLIGSSPIVGRRAAIGTLAPGPAARHSG